MGLKELLKRNRLTHRMGQALLDDASVWRFESQRRRGLRARMPVIERYMSANGARKLHIGAGHNVLQGWLNTDLDPQSREIVYVDITEPMPFPDRSFDLIFSEHLIEHIPHRDAIVHLADCHRVIKPGGRVRVATPDLRFLIDVYTAAKRSEVQEQYLRWTVDHVFKEDGFYDPAFVVNNFVRCWGHQFIYDDNTLGDGLRRAGFSNVRRWPVGESDEPQLKGVEHHGDAISSDFNVMQTIVMEGTRT